MATQYSVIERTPTVAEYNYVRLSAGLGVKDEVAAELGLAGTLYAVCIEVEGNAVGIGRVIGDGGLFFDIVDVAVVAEHWGKGVGKLIMEALMSYVDAHARPSSIVCLMANRGVAPFYEKFGFKARDPDMPGMIIRK
jgi:GNAT superfamily N-acetyltransferase